MYHEEEQPTYGADSDIETLLECLKAYILMLARKKVPRNVVPQDAVELEIDEIAQNALIKLWLALQREHIAHPRAYARSIVHTESVNIVRKYKHLAPLLEDDEGEIYQGTVLVNRSQDTQDPATEYERKEALVDHSVRAVKDVLMLPPRQRYVMICVLKDLADILPIVEIFKYHGVNVEPINWPEDKEELQRMRSLRSVAQKRLRTRKCKYSF